MINLDREDRDGACTWISRSVLPLSAIVQASADRVLPIDARGNEIRNKARIRLSFAWPSTHHLLAGPSIDSPSVPHSGRRRHCCCIRSRHAQLRVLSHRLANELDHHHRDASPAVLPASVLLLFAIVTAALRRSDRSNRAQGVETLRQRHHRSHRPHSPTSLATLSVPRTASRQHGRSSVEGG